MNALNSFIKLPILLSVFVLFTCASCKENTIDIPNVNNGIVFNPNLSYGSVTDIDGNVYKTITIGEQIWMAQNLRTTKYSNGDIIPNVINSSEWAYMNSGAQCSFRNSTNTDSIAKFGRLYNGYAASDKRNIAPTGWHIPSVSDWIILESYLNSKGYFVELNNGYGGICKSLLGTTDWVGKYADDYTNNLSRNNLTGFTAFPNGKRNAVSGSFENKYQDVYWWCSNSMHVDMDGTYQLFKDGGYGTERWGFAIRCIKNSTPSKSTSY